MSSIRPIPEGFRTITPHIIVRDASRAIDFYKQAFGATEINRMQGPNGGIMHAELRIGDSILMLADEFPGMGALSPLSIGGTPVSIHLYVEDVDSVTQQAIAAGATVKMPVSDMFWGDRYGIVADPFGHQWSIATHAQDLTEAEMQQGAIKAMAQMGGK